MGAQNVFERAALVWRHAIRGLAVTESTFHGPAIGRRLQPGVGSERHIGPAKGFQGLETPQGFAAVRLVGACKVRPPDHHDPEKPSGEDAVPYPHPGWEEGSGCLRVRLPSGRGRGEGLGRADPVAFFARRSTLALDPCERRLRECGRESETPDHRDGGGQGTSEGLGGLATIGGHAHGAGGEGCRALIDDAASQGTARARGPLEFVGQRCFARECQANGQAEMVAGPALSGDTPDGPPQVKTPQGALCLSGRAGTVAIVRSALARPAGLFHGGILKADFHDGRCGHERGATADAPGPELMATRAKRPTSQGIIPRAMLHLGCATLPQIRRDGLSARGEDPARGQGGEIVPGGGAEHPMP